jgi:preprotein translocase subunit SecY
MLEVAGRGLSTLILVVVVMSVVVIAFIVFMERACADCDPVSKRRVGNRMFQGQSSHLPSSQHFRRHPPIFASSLLLLPRRSPTGQGPEWFNVIVAARAAGRCFSSSTSR